MRLTTRAVTVCVVVACLLVIAEASLALSIAVQVEGPFVQDSEGGGEQGRGLPSTHVVLENAATSSRKNEPSSVLEVLNG
jgi:hypothetical protein